MGENIFFVILILKFIEKMWIMILKWAKSEEKLFFRGGQCGKKLDRAPAFFLAADAHASVQHRKITFNSWGNVYHLRNWRSLI